MNYDCKIGQYITEHSKDETLGYQFFASGRIDDDKRAYCCCTYILGFIVGEMLAPGFGLAKFSFVPSRVNL